MICEAKSMILGVLFDDESSLLFSVALATQQGDLKPRVVFEALKKR
jgi:hypothetical protein